MSVFKNIKSVLPCKKNVDFIICGVQKGGTTALDEYLREHPEVCMANQKEVHFFDNEEYFTSGKPDYRKYHVYFRPQKNHKILGEATPIYMYWVGCPKRIWKYNPKMKLIVILRNPIERAFSHWNMERMRNTDNLSFEEAIKAEKERCRTALPHQHRVYSYVDRGRYVEQLRRLWEYFPRERVLILKSEDLKKNPDLILNEVTDFLDITHFNSVADKNVHSRPYVSQMSVWEKDYLRSIFVSEVQDLERELKWDCGDWLD